MTLLYRFDPWRCIVDWMPPASKAMVSQYLPVNGALTRQDYGLFWSFSAADYELKGAKSGDYV